MLLNEKLNEYNRNSNIIRQKREDIKNLNKQIATLQAKKVKLIQECLEEYDNNGESKENIQIDYNQVGIVLGLIEASGEDINNLNSIPELLSIYKEAKLSWGVESLLGKYFYEEIENLDFKIMGNICLCDFESDGYDYSGRIEYKDGELLVSID